MVASLSNFRLNGSPIEVETIDDRGRSVATTVVQLTRGDTVRVTWRVRSGPDQDREARLAVTPGLNPTPSVRRIPSTCSESE